MILRAKFCRWQKELGIKGDTGKPVLLISKLKTLLQISKYCLLTSSFSPVLIYPAVQNGC